MAGDPWCPKHGHMLCRCDTKDLIEYAEYETTYSNEDALKAEIAMLRGRVDRAEQVASNWKTKAEKADIAYKEGMKEYEAQLEKAKKEAEKWRRTAQYLHEDYGFVYVTDPEKHTPEDCPTYYDGCNCTVEVLDHNINEAIRLREENDKLREDIGELVDIDKQLDVARDLLNGISDDRVDAVCDLLALARMFQLGEVACSAIDKALWAEINSHKKTKKALLRMIYHVWFDDFSIIRKEEIADILEFDVSDWNWKIEEMRKQIE